MTLEDLRQSLITKRDLAARLEAEYQKKLSAFHAEIQDLVDQRESAKQESADVETILRNMAVSEFLTTKNKDLGYGIGIREYTKYRYDADKALAWAIKGKFCLKLDTKAFESKCAKDHTRPNFVEVWKDPVATIATELKP
jgi:hypothetical protein